jgi:hypothetical protein
MFKLLNLIFGGLLAGLFSTVIMTIFEIPFWRYWGITGILEWHENQILVSKSIEKLRKIKYNQTNYFGIFLLHFINGSLAAIVFPFVFLFFNSIKYNVLFSIILGIIYGILLWLLTLYPIHKPITGLSIIRHPLGKGPLVVSICGHILYGISIGIFVFILL